MRRRDLLLKSAPSNFPAFQGGKSTRVVNCVLALKSFHEWKQTGGNGVWKFGGNAKPATSGLGKSFVRKNSEPFTNSLSRTSSMNDKLLNGPSEVEFHKMVSYLEVWKFPAIFCFSH